MYLFLKYDCYGKIDPKTLFIPTTRISNGENKTIVKRERKVLTGCSGTCKVVEFIKKQDEILETFI